MKPMRKRKAEMKPAIILSVKAENAAQAIEQAQAFAQARSLDVLNGKTDASRAKARRSLSWWNHRIEKIERDWFSADAHTARRTEVLVAIQRNAGERARREVVSLREARAARRRAKLGVAGGDIEVRPSTVRAPMQTDKDGLVVQVQPVVKNIRHDVLEYEFACKRIDEAQKIAGDRLAALIARAGIGGARAMSYEDPKVDGGGKGDTLTDAVADAHKRLRHIRAQLGNADYRILVLTIGEGKSLKDVAGMWACDHKIGWAMKRLTMTVADRWRFALSQLVDVFGVAKGKTGQDVRVWKDHTPLHFGG